MSHQVKKLYLSGTNFFILEGQANSLKTRRSGRSPWKTRILSPVPMDGTKNAEYCNVKHKVTGGANRW